MEDWILRGLVGFLFGIFGLLIRMIWATTRDNKMAIDKVNQVVGTLRTAIAQEFATKEELNRSFDKLEDRVERNAGLVMAKLDKIDDKLDHKADK